LDELKYWLSVPVEWSGRLPKDYQDGRANTEASAQTVTVSLSVEETRALLRDVPAAYGTEINDALLTALAQAFERWMGTRTLLMDLEGHGREDIVDDADISRTVGWFTTVFPVRLDLTGAEGPGEALKVVKEQLRQIPHHGIGYGLLRYLRKDQDVAARLAALPQAEVIFNYLGQLDQAVKSAPFRFAREPIGPSRALSGQRSHAIEVNGSVTDGQLQMKWTYSENSHRRATVEKLAFDFVEALRSLIAHCQSPEAGGYTPSDFADVELSQADIEALVEEVGAA
jgi:non-ribosomal peptide synthase protein (TIGR01720 family)